MSWWRYLLPGERQKVEQELKEQRAQKEKSDLARRAADTATFIYDEDKAVLVALHPIFQVKVRNLLIAARKSGLKVGIHCGLRTLEQQKALYDQGRDATGKVVDKSKVVTNAKPGFSWHQYGLSVDIVMDASDRPGLQPTWKDFVDANGDKVNDWTTLGQLGEACGLVWGGNFSNIVDAPHFQYTKGLADIFEAMSLYQVGRLAAVWEKVVE